VWITSGQSEDGSTGSPLRPFNVIPVFHKLLARIEGKVVAGKQVSISSTFHERHFSYERRFGSFFYAHFGFVIFWQNNVGP